MKTKHFPPGWDEERVRRVLTHYETQTEEAGEMPAGLLKGNCTIHPADPDLLVSLSDAELQALADSVLVPRQQERLSDLSRRNHDEGLSADEERELDCLLERVDHMNVLKARAMHTLQQRRAVSET